MVQRSVAHQPVARVVEKQMRIWELSRAQRSGLATEPVAGVRPFITISRMVSCGGDEVAALLAERLQWPLFDREILQAMAGDDALHQRVYETLDERDLGWVEEMLVSLIHSEYPKNDYFSKLSAAVLSIARKGNAIFLGRAIDMILPSEVGLRVRFVASPDTCVRRFATARQVSLAQARRDVSAIDRERSRFVEKHFRCDGQQPWRFDVTLNLGRFAPAEAVELVMSALHHAEGRR